MSKSFHVVAAFVAGCVVVALLGAGEPADQPADHVEQRWAVGGLGVDGGGSRCVVVDQTTGDVYLLVMKGGPGRGGHGSMLRYRVGTMFGGDDQVLGKDQ